MTFILSFVVAAAMLLMQASAQGSSVSPTASATSTVSVTASKTVTPSATLTVTASRSPAPIVPLLYVNFSISTKFLAFADITQGYGCDSNSMLRFTAAAAAVLNASTGAVTCFGATPTFLAKNSSGVITRVVDGYTMGITCNATSLSLTNSLLAATRLPFILVEDFTGARLLPMAKSAAEQLTAGIERIKAGINTSNILRAFGVAKVEHLDIIVTASDYLPGPAIYVAPLVSPAPARELNAEEIIAIVVGVFCLLVFCCMSCVAWVFWKRVQASAAAKRLDVRIARALTPSGGSVVKSPGAGAPSFADGQAASPEIKTALFTDAAIKV